MGLTRHGFYSVAPTAEKSTAEALEYNVTRGRAYVALDEGSSFKVFSNLVRNGREGYRITRTFPDKVRQRYGLESTPIRWLAETGSKEAIDPTDLAGLSKSIISFMQDATNPVIMLDGFEYLVSLNGFKPVSGFVKRINEANSQKEWRPHGFADDWEVGEAQHPLIQVFQEVKSIQTHLKCPASVIVGDKFPLQLNIFNTGGKSVYLQRVDNILPSSIGLAEELKDYQLTGYSLLLGDKRLQPLELKTISISIRAENSGNVTIDFEVPEAQSAFAYLIKSFTQDYMRSKYPMDQSGWRSLTQISDDAHIPRSTLYLGQGKYGRGINELLARSLIEERVFTGIGDVAVKREIQDLIRQGPSKEVC